MNLIILSGNISSDIKYSNNKIAIAEFNLAIRRDKEKTDFIRLKAFGKTADLINGYCKKGDTIAIEGSIRNNNYTDSQGTQHYKDDYIISTIEFIKKATPKKKDPTELEDSDLPWM